MHPAIMHGRQMRIDSISSSESFFTEEGFFRDTPVVTSVGIFEYKNPDGSVRRELRLPEEVFDKKSLASYMGAPIVLTHNRAKEDGSINKDNVADEIVGTVLSDGYADGMDVRCKIVIHDIDKVKATNARELSLGYDLDLDETPGTWKGEHYDAIQRNIRINHLAIVNTARAGDQAHLNLDGDDSGQILKGGRVDMTHANDFLSPDELVQAILNYTSKRLDADEEKNPFQKKAEGAAPEAAPAPAGPKAPVAPAGPKAEVAPAVPDLQTEEEEPKTDAGEDTDATLISLLEKLLTALKGKKAPAEEAPVATDADEENENEEEPDDDIDDFEYFQEPRKTDADDTPEDEDIDDFEYFQEPKKEEKTDSPDDGFGASLNKSKSKATSNADSADTIVKERLAICRLGDQLHMDGLEDMSIRDGKKAIIKKIIPEMRLDGRDDAYINACFDIAISAAKRRKNTEYQRQQMMSGLRMDGKEVGTAAERARQRMIDREEGIDSDD